MMTFQNINNLIPSIEQLGSGGYWIAFFAALVETTIGLGLIFPGSTIILFLGALSARGYLDAGDLICVAVLRTDALTNIFNWITVLGKSRVILGFIAISVGLLWIWRKRYCILPLLIAVVGSEAFTYLGKLTFHRPRPEMAVYTENSFSFPSGHATIAVAFYGFAGYLIVRFAHSWNRKVNIFFMTLLLITAIGFSRIYLGVHYVSDVWSGYLVGAMWLIVAVSLSEWLRQKVKEDRSISPVAGARPISFVLAFVAIGF